MTQIVVEDEGSDPQALGGSGNGRKGGHRAELVDQVVGNHERVEPDRLRTTRQLGELGSGGRRTRIGEEIEGAHVVILPGLACRSQHPGHRSRGHS